MTNQPASPPAAAPPEGGAKKKNPWIGRVLNDRYEITGTLGAGGFATVFKGKHLQIEQEVAIKILQMPDSEGDATFAERFLREAKTASQIKHPDVVQIFDYGMLEDGAPFMVMEMLVGSPLDVVLRKEGAMDPLRAQRLFVRCLDALEAAHDLGIVHRDLKPANLFLIGAGTRIEAIKILDFGIALMLEEDTRLTNTGQVFGTPRYLAPEYIQKQLVTPALDVYQMGLIFAECLMGRNIIEADNTFTFIYAHCNGEIQVPRDMLESPLGPVLTRALNTDHTQRFSSAGPFRDALDTVPPEHVKGLDFALPRNNDDIPEGTMVILRDYFTPMEDDSKPIALPGSATKHVKVDSAKTLDPEVNPRALATQALDDADIEVITEGLAGDPALAPIPATAPPSESSSGRSPLLLIGALLGGLGLLIILGVGAMAILGGGDDSNGTGGTAKGGENGATASNKGGSGAAVAKSGEDKKADGKKDDDGKAPDKAVEKAPEKKPVSVAITVEPKKAAIFKGDETIGEAGIATLNFEGEDAEAVKICVRLKRYQEDCRDISAKDSPRVDIRLKRKGGSAVKGGGGGKKGGGGSKKGGDGGGFVLPD